MVQFHIITIFPDIIRAYTDESIIGRAQKDKKMKVSFYNPRDFTNDLPAPRPGRYFVYVVLCSNDAMYIGQTQDLQKRWEQHRLGRGGEYTRKYRPKALIHFETYGSREDAVSREKWLKTGFGRKWIKREYAAGRTRQAGRHKKVDDRPFGGGPGMVMQAEPILRAVKRAVGRKRKKKIVLLSPRGKQFDQAYAKELAGNYKDIVLICGHYEGIDARVKKALNAEEVSVGPYTLTGGEVPALAVLDAVSRQIPGVLGKAASLEETRVSSGEMYTRPESIRWNGKTYRVPNVLLSGHHKEIEQWKQNIDNQ